MKKLIFFGALALSVMCAARENAPEAPVGPQIGRLAVTNSGDLVALTSGGRIFKKSPLGSWKLVKSDRRLRGNELILRHRDEIFIANFDDTLLRSRDGGLTWDDLGAVVEPGHRQFWEQYSRFDRSTFNENGDFYTIENNQVLYTRDGGRNWSKTSQFIDKVGDDLPVQRVVSVGELLIVLHGNRLFKSQNSGKTWQLVVQLNPATSPVSKSVVENMMCGPRGELFVTTREAGQYRVYRSTDAGADWHQEDFGLGLPSSIFLKDFHLAGGALFVAPWPMVSAQATNSAVISIDGRTGKEVPDLDDIKLAAQGQNGEIYLVSRSSDKVLKSPDHGSRWTEIPMDGIEW